MIRAIPAPLCPDFWTTLRLEFRLLRPESAPLRAEFQALRAEFGALRAELPEPLRAQLVGLGLRAATEDLDAIRLAA